MSSLNSGNMYDHALPWIQARGKGYREAHETNALPFNYDKLFQYLEENGHNHLDVLLLTKIESIRDNDYEGARPVHPEDRKQLAQFGARINGGFVTGTET